MALGLTSNFLDLKIFVFQRKQVLHEIASGLPTESWLVRYENSMSFVLAFLYVHTLTYQLVTIEYLTLRFTWLSSMHSLECFARARLNWITKHWDVDLSRYIDNHLPIDPSIHVITMINLSIFMRISKALAEMALVFSHRKSLFCISIPNSLHQIDSRVNLKSSYIWLPRIYDQDIGRWLQTCGGSEVICGCSVFFSNKLSLLSNGGI